MNEAAYELLFDRLSGEDGPEDALVDLILAAAEGDVALEALLGGQDAPARRAPATVASAAEPTRVYLESITVENFRGVADAASLRLEPRPGLTLVVGRNGSGKSSFAEGLELLLTGVNVRWEDRTKVWKEGWRNLHGSGPTTISARFRVDGECEPLEVRRRWPTGAALDAGEPRTVSGPRESWSELDWDGPLQRFRPLLSYHELGTMFSTRAAALYEALSAVLGVQEFDEVAARLRAARLALSKSEKQERTERATLKARLQEVNDTRAAAIAEALARRTPDLEAIERLTMDEDAPRPDEASLLGLARLEVPSAEDIAERLAKLELAVTELNRLQRTDAERLDALSRLLTDALGFHERHGDGQTCPVCGTPDVLDPGWFLRTQAEVEVLRGRSSELKHARTNLNERRADVERLFASSISGVLRAVRLADAGIDTADAEEAWDLWAALLRGEPHDVVRRGGEVGQRLSLSLSLLRDDASTVIEERRDAWRPVQQAVLAWLVTARRAARDKESVTKLKAAEVWMASLAADLRRERLKPIVEAAQANWSELRHESNVELGKVELRKEGMQRYAAFDVTVDGTPSSAFGVMSQGELSALAVSVFLPRASLPDSPFGFMVIDDPVQSMDPAKVDGLARVLARAAKDRQVVVFTHDERLPEAVRRLAIEARIVSVKRRAASKIEIVAGRPPSDRYIGEAFALAKTDDLPAEVRARVVPGFCRSAVEAACEARIRRRLIEAGTPHAEVEKFLSEPRKLTAWLAEAFELSVAQGTEVTERVRRIGGEDAVRAVALMRKGVHQLVRTDGLQFVEATKQLVRALEPA